MKRPRTDIITTLRSDIMMMEGLRPINNTAIELGLGPICSAFPESTFPIGAVHEFLSADSGHIASTNGFVACLLSKLMGDLGTALWISTSRTIFPPALREFGVEPDKVMFVDLNKEKDVLWAVEEALKCSAITAVVGELKDLTFTESRRLQLAVEHSQVTGFLLRKNVHKLNTTACVSRWRISSLPSDLIDDLPGVGFPQWRVELLRIRNGQPGNWNVRWVNGRFAHDIKIDESVARKKAG